MNTAVLTRGFPLVWSSPLSLARLLSAYHIPIVDTSLAVEHKRKMIDESRVGIFRIVGPILYALTKVMSFFFNQNDRRAVLSLLFLVATFVVSAIGAFMAPDVPTIDPLMHLAFWSTIVIFAVVFVHGTLTDISLFRPVFFEYVDASTIWERRAVKDAEGKLDLSFVPTHLHDRIKRASQIPDAEVFIERFSYDPLILVSRRQGLFAETVYIGGWDTHNPLIDDA